MTYAARKFKQENVINYYHRDNRKLYLFCKKFKISR